MPDMINIIGIVGLILVACIAWVVWTERKSKQAFDKDALDQAWREAPDDPFSVERHHYEERKRVVDQARAGATDPDCAPPGQCPRQKLSYSTKDKEATADWITDPAEHNFREAP
jgi:FtsZ-interacting cell division protein ZipA